MEKKMKLMIKNKNGKTGKSVRCVIGKNYFRMLAFTGVSLLLTGACAFAAEIDGQIESAAKNSFIFKTYLRDDSVRVKSIDGNVTLTGKVNQEQEKDLAEEAVENLQGVRSVDNNLEVTEPSEPELSDAWIGTKVKTMLLFHTNVSGTKTQVDVKDGVVTLSGEADSEAQKELTGRYTGDIEGVKGVVNDLKVVSSEKKDERPLKEKIDDASITAQIKAALLIHRSTSALKTEVHTEQGVVTVKGEAKNMAEKELVTKIIQDIHGVKNIENEMTVLA